MSMQQPQGGLKPLHLHLIQNFDLPYENDFEESYWGSLYVKPQYASLVEAWTGNSMLQLDNSDLSGRALDSTCYK
ncbi:MAG: hypothetical protein R3C11_11150 [Planctomycetaceae bacterium]